MISCFSEITTVSFLNKLKKAKFEMGYEALKRWPQWVETVNQYDSDRIDIQKGTYVVLNSKSGRLDTENYHLMVQALEEYQEPYQDILPADIPGINSLESCRPLRALYLPNEGYINPIHFLKKLKNLLQLHYNLVVFDCGIEKVKYKNHMTAGVILKTGEHLVASKVVLATGAYTQNILNQIPELKNEIPIILSGVGYALVVEAAQSSIKHVVRTPNRAGSCGLHVLPRDENSFYIGATNNLYLSPQSTMRLGLSQFLMKCAVEQIDQNFYNAEVTKWIVGNRPVTIDTFPLIGSTSLEGLYLSTGTYREGFHLSPYIAPYMASVILEDKIKENNLLKPERSFIKMMSIEESIKEYAFHYIAGSYEHGMNLPLFLHEKEFLRPLGDQVRGIYDKIGIDFGLSPDILLMITLSEEPDSIINNIKNYFSYEKRNQYKEAA